MKPRAPILLSDEWKFGPINKDLLCDRLSASAIYRACLSSPVGTRVPKVPGGA